MRPQANIRLWSQRLCAPQ